MQLIDDYMRLFGHKPDAAIGSEIPFSLSEVAAALCCTPRNGKLILGRLIERNWISWMPGRGRGNRSHIKFLVEPVAMIDGVAREWVHQGHVQKALALIEKHAEAHPALSDRFSQWFRGYFGMHHLSVGEKTVDTLRLRLDFPVTGLDPAAAWLRSDSHMLKQVYNTLVAYHPATDTVDPMLAYHWEMNERGDVWTFFLRKGVLFHHGQPLRAIDVVASFARIRDRDDSHYRWMLAGIKRIEAVAERVIRFELEQPNHLFLQLLASEYLSIVPAEYAEVMGAEFARLPVGTGPFRVVRNDESMLVLEAFSSYFRERAHLDRIEFVVLGEHGLADKLLDESAYGIRYESVLAGRQLPASIRGWRQLERTESCVQYIAFNMRKNGPLADKRFRQALALILDGARLTTELGGNRCEPVRRMMPGANLFAADAERADPAMLLAQCGYAGEVLRLHTFPDDDHREDAAWIEAQCARYGIKVESAFFDAQTLLTPACIGAADIIHDSASIGEDVEVSLVHVWLAGHSFVQQLLDAATQATIAKRVKLLYGMKERGQRLRQLAELEDELLDAFAYHPLYRNEARLLAHPDLAGVTINEQGWVEYAKLWFR
ncbi:ABC transporter substrate-binding protein [Brevibacillus fluminis]|uniref:SgrR family transcriptional regulator n=1 Tax=Brevibacillus fluminis TaxID=511487 RepID=UPI003F8CCACA